MIDVTTLLPAKRKNSSGGWISFNGPCCIHNGESQDKRMRGGMKLNSDGSWSYHCFNCNFKTSFTLGRSVSFKARNFLTWLGVDKQTIDQLNFESLRHGSLFDLVGHKVESIAPVTFNETSLPENLEPLNGTNPKHKQYIDYLTSRSIKYEEYPYMVSPNEEGRASKRIVIPFTHNGVIVGNTARFIDDRQPKYINDTQPGYVFGMDLQQKDWEHLFVVEGIFDAISINSVAVLHNDINNKQVQIIRSAGKQITVVPDKDKAGLKLVDRAIELGWAVSFPEWPEGCKDVNDAVKCMGKLATILSIIRARQTNELKIKILRKEIGSRLQH